jgi:hypothetical protein
MANLLIRQSIIASHYFGSTNGDLQLIIPKHHVGVIACVSQSQLSVSSSHRRSSDTTRS